MVLFKNRRDKLQISILACQMYTGNNKYFLECYQDATARPYGYILVDLKESTQEEFRIRSGLFSWENPAVRVPKKKAFKY